jgi:hypothetical protein
MDHEEVDAMSGIDEG